MRRPAAILAAAAALCLLSGCAAGSPGGERVGDYAGGPKGVEAPPSSAGGAPFAVWLRSGDQLAITLYGSSSCPPVVESLTAGKANSLTITVKDYGDRPCTADYGPHTSVFSTPSAVDRSKALELALDDFSFSVPPAT